MLKFVSLFISIFFTLLVKSQNLENTPLCQKAYKNIIALKIDSGKYFLTQEKLLNPNNTYIEYLSNYIDFLVVFTSRDMEYYENTVKENANSRIEIIENSQSINSPYYLFTQAEIYLQSSILSVINKDYITAIFHLRKALKKLEENTEKFPKFKENKKSLGLLYSLLGSVPDNLKTGLSIFGLNGDIKKGMKMLKTLSEDNTFKLQHETATIYAFMLLHLNNDKEKAWEILIKHNFFNATSQMDNYAIAHIGIYGLHNNEAVKFIESRPFNKNFIPFPLIDYILGIGKTYKLDNDANKVFKQFLKEYKGKDYIKSTYQKMAWNELLKGNINAYKEYISKIEKNGRSVIDADKQAIKEIDLLLPPNKILLKARLLSDGNYTENAFKLLNKYTIDDFLMPKEKVEYQYRIGRILHKQKKYTQALSYYLKTMQIDNKVEAYFAANACYLIGNIYEKQNNADKALKYYEKCLKMNGYEYENSIKQKAKAGKNRLSKKFW